MTDREIAAIFIGIVCGVILSGLLMLVDPPDRHSQARAISLPITPDVSVDLTGPQIEWRLGTTEQPIELGCRSDGVVVWREIDAEAKP